AEGSAQGACQERAALPPSAAISLDDVGQAIDELPFHLLGASAPGLPWKSRPPASPDKARPLRLSPNLERQGILLFEVRTLRENLLHRRCAPQTLRPSHQSPALALLQNRLPA